MLDNYGPNCSASFQLACCSTKFHRISLTDFWNQTRGRTYVPDLNNICTRKNAAIQYVSVTCLQGINSENKNLLRKLLRTLALKVTCRYMTVVCLDVIRILTPSLQSLFLIQDIPRGMSIFWEVMLSVTLYMCHIPNGFRNRAISLYSSKIVDKKQILPTVSNTVIYCSRDKVCIDYPV
jgi:hypothetical protein